MGPAHKPIVAGAAALLLTAVAALSAGIFLVGREQRKTEIQRREAVQQGELVSEKAESLRRRDAVSRVNLAYREYLDDNVALADELLTAARPTSASGNGSMPADWATRSSRAFSGSSLGQDVWSVAFSPDCTLWPAAPAPGVSPGASRPASCWCARSKPAPKCSHSAA